MNERFIARHMMYERIAPDEPTSDPFVADAGRLRGANPFAPAPVLVQEFVHGVPLHWLLSRARQTKAVIPVEISVFEDRSFTFVTKTPPAARMLLKAAGVEKGSGEPHKTKVATVTRDQVREIATTKLPDLNANDIDAAMKIVEGTARSMGVTVEG